MMQKIAPLTAVLAISSLCGCGGSGGSDSASGGGTPQYFKIGGAVSGLSGAGLVLLDNLGDALAVSANGTFTFPTALQAGTTYSVTVGTQPSTSGAISETCSVTSGSGTVSAAVTNVRITCGNTAARFVYLVDDGSNGISAYAIDNQTGALTPLSGSPYATGASPGALALTPNGKFGYVNNTGDNSISAYAVSSTNGALSPITGSPYMVTPYTPTVGHTLTPVAIDPSGLLAIVGNPAAPYAGTGSDWTQPGNLGVFSIGASTGALTPVTGSPFTTGSFYPALVALDPADKFFYVVNYPYQIGADEASMSVYSINASVGAVASVAGSPFNPLPRNPLSFTVAPSGMLAYMTNDYTQAISWFSLNATTGTFTVPGGYTGSTTYPPALLTNGQWLYAVGLTNVYAYSVDATTGALMPVSGSPYNIGAGNYPTQVVADPANKHLYVLSPPTTLPNSGTPANYVYEFDIDSATGALSPISGSPFVIADATEEFAGNFVIEPAGRFAYIPSSISKLVYALSIDPNTGALAAVPGSPFATGTSPGKPVFLY